MRLIQIMWQSFWRDPRQNSWIRERRHRMRIFEKYAVRIGGGFNHSYNLSDGVLLKDNHIGAARRLAKAVQMAKEYAPFVRKIEVETENLDMVRAAVDAGAALSCSTI